MSSLPPPKPPIGTSQHNLLDQGSSSYPKDDPSDEKTEENTFGLFKKQKKIKNVKKAPIEKVSLVKKLFGKKNSESAKIDKEIKEDIQKKSYELNVLLLGCGGSGKTTLFKQMDRIYSGMQHFESHNKMHTNIVRHRVLLDFCEICQHNSSLKETYPGCALKPGNDEICDRLADMFDALDDGAVLIEYPELVQQMTSLWHDPGFQFTFQKLNKHHNIDNLPYFLDRLKEMSDAKFECSFEDFVKVRHRTTGVVEKKFKVKSAHGNFTFYTTDIGGQRAERRKWQPLFDDIDIVIYVMNLAGYDKLLYEDSKTNCFDETLELFYRTSHNPAFDKTDFVVLLNKWDLFQKKVKTIPFTAYKKEFSELHKHDPDKVREFVQDQFALKFVEGLSQERRDVRGELHFHTCCCTDFASIQSVILVIQDELIKSKLKKVNQK